ncbi:MAG: DUF6308 family protein [Actinomycetaceae bacterium]|nr:DUF6308 family protein [Actinomycetaceae bacterium]
MTLRFPSLIEGIVDGDADAWNRASELLHHYFVTDTNLSHTFFTMYGTDHESDPHRIHAVDIVALLALDIGGLKGKRQEIMEDKNGDLCQLFRQIPVDMDLVDASDDFLADDGAPAQLWNLLCAEDGFALKPKVATTLLARKRPRLFPLILPVHQKILKAPDNLIATMRDLASALRKDDGRLAYQLYYLNSAAQISDNLSQIELLCALIYTDEKQRRAEEKAYKKMLAKRQAEQAKIRKKQKKQQKKLKKLQKKSQAAQAHKKEYQKRQQLQASLDHTSPISTSAFKLRPTHVDDDQFAYPLKD